MPEAEENKNTEKPSIWLKRATWATIVYLVSIGIVIIITPELTEANVGCSKLTWRAIVYGCLTLNELGDFLAGAFAPLAFIWLAAAVFIQSEELKAQRLELKAQRHELVLTRQSVDDNREVMQAQANVAKKQAEYIGQQTDILKLEQRTREEEKKLKIFHDAISRLAGCARDNSSAISFKSKNGILFNFSLSMDGSETTDVGQVRKISSTLNEKGIFDFEAANHSLAGSDKFSANHPLEFDKFFGTCVDAVIAKNNLSKDSEILIKTLRLNTLFRSLKFITDKVDNLDVEQWLMKLEAAQSRQASN